MKKYKVLLFITAISQIVSTFFTSFSGGSNFNELLITPAGYTFAIWGAITLFTSIFAFYHLFFDRHFFTKKFYLFNSLVYICFTLWLLVAERDLLLPSIVIILAMYYSLVQVIGEAVKDSYRNWWYKIFLLGGTGMYLGWISIASVLNIAVYTFSFGLQNISETGVFVQMVFVGITTISAGLALYVSRFSKVVFGTHWWAFVGLLVGLILKPNTGTLIVLTLSFVVSLNIYYFKNFLFSKSNLR